jgi:hypothetical protein
MVTKVAENIPFQAIPCHLYVCYVKDFAFPVLHTGVLLGAVRLTNTGSPLTTLLEERIVLLNPRRNTDGADYTNHAVIYLFNDAVSSSDYIASNDGIINELERMKMRAAVT